MAKIFSIPFFMFLQTRLEMFKAQLKASLLLRVMVSMALAVVAIYGILLLPLSWAGMYPAKGYFLSGMFAFLALGFAYCAWMMSQDYQAYRDEMGATFGAFLALFISITMLAASHFTS